VKFQRKEKREKNGHCSSKEERINECKGLCFFWGCFFSAGYFFFVFGLLFSFFFKKGICKKKEFRQIKITKNSRNKEK
jgi:hypothetical protein